MYPDLGFSGESTTTETFVFGVAPTMKNQHEASGEGVAETHARSCGSGCKCGNGCGGCKMYPDLGFSGESTTTETFVFGVAPAMKNQYEASGEGVAENDACKCGSDCKCDPCTCK